ncbi:MAG TPA: ATP-grasp domain-containing protein [Solirubrobacteraceae bacterium]
MTPRRVLWLGAAGTVTAHGIARRVRAAWGDGVGIVAVDINPPALVAAADLADACEQVPPVADRDAFAAALGDGIRRHGVDTYVPLLVEEIALACELRDAGALPGVALLAPGTASARLCTDKLALARRLDAEGIAAPPTVLAQDARWWPEGVVVKARGGEGSRGVEVLVAEADLERVRGRGDAAVAQRRCEGPEVTVDAFRSRDGTVWAALCRERVEVRAGVCTKARLHRDAALEALVRRVADALELSGALCVQAMRGPGGWEITDVNPRYGGASAMSAAAGVDTAAAALADLWGEDPRPFLGDFAGEAWVVRSYEESLRR